jgi:hypothetical protein
MRIGMVFPKPYIISWLPFSRIDRLQVLSKGFLFLLCSTVGKAQKIISNPILRKNCPPDFLVDCAASADVTIARSGQQYMIQAGMFERKLNDRGSGDRKRDLETP